MPQTSPLPVFYLHSNLLKLQSLELLPSYLQKILLLFFYLTGMTVYVCLYTPSSDGSNVVV